MKVQAEDGTASSAEAVSIGLIVAELVINAFKHALVGDEAAGLVVVAYEVAETSWKLTVSDNRIGTPEGQLDSDKPRPGLGTIIGAALAKQLDARVEVIRKRVGTMVSITHGTSDRAWASACGRRHTAGNKPNMGTRVTRARQLAAISWEPVQEWDFSHRRVLRDLALPNLPNLC